MDCNIRIYTAFRCSDCRQAKEFLNVHGLQFEETDIEEVPETAQHVVKANEEKRRVPTFETAGRVFHCSPFNPICPKTEWGID